jgi:D-3-phosphoglycerate dehydrogenase / 2-oxoglutarate reductase
MPSALVLATAPLNDYAATLLAQFGDIVVAPDVRESTLAGLMPGTVALVVRGAAPITAAVLANAGDLRVIGRTGVGYENVDIVAATRRRIPVVYTPGVGARAVGEATVAFMLALCKQLDYWDRQFKAGNWKSRFEVQGRDLDGQILGIIGLGRIGRMVAEMVRPFNMTLIAHDPFVSAEEGARCGARMTGSLEDLLCEADFISIHCPQLPETMGLINRARLELVKPGSYLLNLARGGMIESFDILHDALRTGRLAGVALDVFEPEPPDFSHPLFAMPNCLTAPHSMATTKGAMTRIFKSMADDMAAILRGEMPNFVVNPEVLPG